MDIATSTVAARPGSFDESDRLECIEMMGEEVGAEPEPATQFDGGAVTASEGLDDGQTDRITERSVPGGSKFEEVCRGHVRLSHGTQDQSMIIE